MQKISTIVAVAMSLFGKKKITANEVADLFLTSLAQMLSEYWPRMSENLILSAGLPPERLRTDEALVDVYLAFVATHYHDLPKLFDSEVTDALRRNIWYGITRKNRDLGQILRQYMQAMEASELEGDLYLNGAAAVLLGKLGGDSVPTIGNGRILSPTAIMAITEFLTVFDLDWWRRLQSKFSVQA